MPSRVNSRQVFVSSSLAQRETASAKDQLEQGVLVRLPKSERRPHDLVTAALSRICYAKSLFGKAK